MIIDYPYRVSKTSSFPIPRLFVTVTGVVSEAEVESEINAGRPVVAAITPGGLAVGYQAAAHVALIVGYRRSADLLLEINDPFPFDSLPSPNPYVSVGARPVQAGKYEVTYRDFKRGLGWSESFLVRNDGYH